MTVLHKAFRTMSFILLLVGASLTADNSSRNSQPSIELLNNNFLDKGCKSCTLKSKKISKKFKPNKKHTRLTYYLNVADFVESFIEIPTANVLPDSYSICFGLNSIS